jgi:hypothetical protein
MKACGHVPILISMWPCPNLLRPGLTLTLTHSRLLARDGVDRNPCGYSDVEPLSVDNTAGSSTETLSVETFAYRRSLRVERSAALRFGQKVFKIYDHGTELGRRYAQAAQARPLSLGW